MTTTNKWSTLDLFCGMGGLGLGFAWAGFRLLGVDADEHACETYRLNNIGEVVCADLTKREADGEFDVVIGGPPCEPWSLLNLTKRGRRHPRYSCLKAFYDVIRQIKPLVFVMENVMAVRSEPVFQACISAISRLKYLVSTRVIKYSDYGAATSRRRLFVIGTKKGLDVTPDEVFDRIPRRPARTVHDVIWDLREREFDPSIDHVWPRVKTIKRYLRYYRSGRYGWYILDWNKPAPSFGNIAKTYILHPDSFNGGMTRPISVREALRIMGFPDSFRFPDNTGLNKKYEMVADSVSPVFSAALASTLKIFLG